MSRYKTLISNTMIFTISNFSSKLLVFFMLPVYTRVMTTADFGVSDLINSSVGLLMPIFTLSIADGVLRFALRPDADDKQVFSFGIKVIFAGFGILLLAIPFFLKIEVIKDYLVLFYLTYITSIIDNYLGQFARGIGKIKLVGIVGLLSTGIVIASNILFLIVFHMGVTGFLISIILSHIIVSIVLFVGGGMYRYLSIKHTEKQLITNLLQYSIPLAPNALCWWLNNASNRYIIAAFCGIPEVGLFSVATKIPVILTTFQGVFQQAWQLSAIAEYEKEDNGNFYIKVYKGFNLVSILVCSLLIIFTKSITWLLFSKDFYEAWHYVPLLLVATMFGALSGFIGTSFSVVNKTRILFFTTLVGGIVSVACNYLLVPFFGPMGACISSVISYIVIWIIRLIGSLKYVKMVQYPFRDAMSYMLLTIQAILYTYIEGVGGYIGALIACSFILVINIKDINYCFQKIKQLTRSRHNTYKNKRMGE